jgi:hypothetical protein
MPPFLFHLLAVIVLIFLSELERDEMLGLAEDQSPERKNFIRVQKNLV